MVQLREYTEDEVLSRSSSQENSMWLTKEQKELLNIPKDYPTDKPIKEDASGYFEKEVYEAVKPYIDEYLYS